MVGVFGFHNSGIKSDREKEMTSKLRFTGVKYITNLQKFILLTLPSNKIKYGAYYNRRCSCRSIFNNQPIASGI